MYLYVCVVCFSIYSGFDFIWFFETPKELSDRPWQNEKDE